MMGVAVGVAVGIAVIPNTVYIGDQFPQAFPDILVSRMRCFLQAHQVGRVVSTPSAELAHLLLQSCGDVSQANNLARQVVPGSGSFGGGGTGNGIEVRVGVGVGVVCDACQRRGSFRLFSTKHAEVEEVS